MSEYEEGIFIIAVYLFVVVVFTLPFLVTYLFIKISRTVNRANRILTYVEETEEDARKYG
jgi:hypothetical protein